eukprot:TRINITY_DN111982_c0_g1_i1.p6 TRINITY_DN111982_c0_g1~~TRINITY_DN111982_c0_g1_i1.p6  ORF type:complete len:112 (+),score=13.83 TRINITY_DN111982_c0_g1_i1:746-1081(+)
MKQQRIFDTEKKMKGLQNELENTKNFSNTNSSRQGSKNFRASEGLQILYLLQQLSSELFFFEQFLKDKKLLYNILILKATLFQASKQNINPQVCYSKGFFFFFLGLFPPSA